MQMMNINRFLRAVVQFCVIFFSQVQVHVNRRGARGPQAPRDATSFGSQQERTQHSATPEFCATKQDHKDLELWMLGSEGVAENSWR